MKNSNGECVLNFCLQNEILKNQLVNSLNHSSKTNLNDLLWGAMLGIDECFNVDDVDDAIPSADWNQVVNADGTPLILLAVSDLDLVEEILKDSDDFHPEQLIVRLIQSGVDLNVVHNETGKGPLHILSSIDSDRSLQIIRQIVESKRVDLHLKDNDGNIPLHAACGAGNEAAVVLFLHEGIDINTKGQDGRTALHFSASSGYENLVKILLDCGADVTMVDDRGMTPYDLADDSQVRVSLKEAWSEAVSRKRKCSTDSPSPDLSDSNSSNMLSKSLMSDRIQEKKQTQTSKIKVIQSLPILPAISPRQSKAIESNDQATTQFTTTLDAVENRKATTPNGRRFSTKPRLRRWRSTSAGCLAVSANSPSSGSVRLPPLHIAVFELDISDDDENKTRKMKVVSARPRNHSVTPEGGSDSEPEGSSQSSRKMKTLQTTMPCRVPNLTGMMVLGHRPVLASDMTIESVSARSNGGRISQAGSPEKAVSDPSSPLSSSASSLSKTNSEKGRKGNAKKALSKEKKKPSSSSSDNRLDKMSGVGVRAAKKPVLIRRNSMPTFVTKVPNPPKELPPLFPKFGGESPHGVESMFEKALRPALTIQPVFHEQEENQEPAVEKLPLGSSEAKVKPNNANSVKTCQKTSAENKQQKAKMSKKPKDKEKSKTTSKKLKSSTVKKGQQENVSVGGVGANESPSSSSSLTLNNGVTIRLPMDGKALNEEGQVVEAMDPHHQVVTDDQNSLRALSEIVQLSTVVEEDELLASLRCSVKNTPRPGYLIESDRLIETEIAEVVASDDERTLTPNEVEEMEKEMQLIGNLVDDFIPNISASNSLALQPLCDEEQQGGQSSMLENEGEEEDDEGLRLERAASRASATRNPVIFEEDHSLEDENGGEEDQPDFSSASLQPLLHQPGNNSNLAIVDDGGGGDDENGGRNLQRQQQQVAGGNSRRSSLDPTRSLSRASTSSNIEMQQSIRWRKGNEIGHGGYGKVFLALTSLGGLIAVKQIDMSRFHRDTIEREYERIDEEVNILRALKHPSVVEFYGTSYERDVVNIFMEYIAGGSIASILRRFGPLEENVFKRYTKQLLKAVRYLHSNGVVHRDIKGANVMVTGEGLIKLIDFGCARQLVESAVCGSSHGHSNTENLKTGGQLVSAKGTPYWMAPEVICETGHGRKSDIWSIGCTIFEMATRRPPWADLEPSAAMFAIASGRRAIPQLPSPPSSQLARDFVAQCLTRQPQARPTAAELLQHKWFSSSAKGRSSSKR